MAGILDFLSSVMGGGAQQQPAQMPQQGQGDVPEGVRKIFGMNPDELKQRIRAIGAGMATPSGEYDGKLGAFGRGFGGAQKYMGEQEEAARKQELLTQQQTKEDAQWREKMDFEKAMEERRVSIAERQLEKKGASDFDRRREEAASLGMTEDDPAYRSYILTGKMPREDQAPLTSTDKKAILEADEMISANEGALNALDHAISISNKANQGYGASSRAAIGNNLPDLMVPDFVSSPESSAATADYDNAVVGQALQQLKATFGAAPTEGERKILLELQGSSNLPHDVRIKILERAKAMAERRLEFNRSRADQLRGGDFYKPQGVHDPSAIQEKSLSGPAEDPLGIRN